MDIAICAHRGCVLKVDCEVGNKKKYDFRTYLALAEAAMAERVKTAVTALRGAGTALREIGSTLRAAQ
jgi:fructose-bisphosphate aldolase, class II